MEFVTATKLYLSELHGEQHGETHSLKPLLSIKLIRANFLPSIVEYKCLFSIMEITIGSSASNIIFLFIIC